MPIQPTPPVPTPLANMGESVPRYEAVAKVTGQPLYAADHDVANPAYAFLITAGIAKGRITRIDTQAAEAIPGVVKIYTYKNTPRRIALKHFSKGGAVSDSILPLVSPQVSFDGEIIGMAVADTFETAREAAHAVIVDYAPETPTASFDDPGAKTIDLATTGKKEKAVGDFAKGFAAAPVTIDAHYSTPTMHHNPMELFSTTAWWDGDELIVYEPSQFVYGLKNGVAEQIGLDPAKARVINPFVGGAFGSKGIMSQRTAIAAVAAKELKRPVKMVVMRDQGFTTATYRAETRHHIKMGADRSGKLVAFSHEGLEVTSRQDDYSVAGTETTAEMYACPNVATKVSIVKADRNTPGFMRSPPEAPYMYALESAIDEMAIACGVDPVEFRRINDTQVSPINGAPYTSRSLMKCFDEASASFGWSKRTPQPMSMRDGDWMIGYGCATAVYPTNMMPAAARVRLSSDGKARVQIAAHDVGTGAYTVMQQVAASRLGLPIGNVRVEMGDSDLPVGPVAGGSMTTASAGSAVAAACDKVVARFGNTMPAITDLPAAFDRIHAGTIEEYAEWKPQTAAPDATRKTAKGKMGSGQQKGDDETKKPLMMAFGAEFVEVRVNRFTREVRVPRMTGAFAAGRIVNPRTARSQYLGGMIWGLGQALLEQTELDRKRARYVNDNIAEYLVAMNADVPEVDIILVPEVDTQVNPLGVKGIGELANVGTAAAIANAVYHATGKRIRDLPITIEKLI